ncbi:MAG: PH domain-containing protein [Clostridia bacterium]
MAKEKKAKKQILWKDRKRTFLGLPWSFTKYRLTDESLTIETGFLNSTEDEVRLYRITDVTLKRSFGQKLLGIGTIHCDSSDVTMQNFDIKNVKRPKKVKELLSRLVNESRMKNRVYTSESVNGRPHVFEGDLPPAEHGHPDDAEH